ncbi:MAG: hypothetical protein DRM98_05340 [Thermoplasmata archaeon]|nr:MAG: hypothetical protein DRM98_05340 [Thermoplasmata archaeon]
MSNWRNTGITTIILLTILLLVGLTVASVITGENTQYTNEQNYDQMTEEVINEISTYIQIKDQKGKYYNINGTQKIEKIALLISPLVSQDIDVTQLTIQLDNGEKVKILSFDGNASKIDSNTLFNHPIWKNLTGNNFGFISIVDLDNSLIDHNTINDYSDNIYVVFKLPNDMTLEKRDKLIVTLFPSTGITRTTLLEAPLPIHPIVTFE